MSSNSFTCCVSLFCIIRSSCFLAFPRAAMCPIAGAQCDVAHTLPNYSRWKLPPKLPSARRTGEQCTGHRHGLRAHREWPRGRAAHERDERAPFHSITSSAHASSVMKSRWSDAYCYVAGCGVDCHVMNFQPFGVCVQALKEHEPQAARLAIDLRLDRRAAGDECGVAR